MLLLEWSMKNILSDVHVEMYYEERRGFLPLEGKHSERANDQKHN